MKPIRKIMIVAGEASGDAHAAKLVDALRHNAPEIQFEFFGATGEKLRAAGVETVLNSDNLAIIGLPEIARALPVFWRAFRTLKNAAFERKPDAVILVDFPDFNLKLAKSLHKKGLKIVYYISPQLWAWRGYRRRTVEKSIDLLLTILPFEKDWYARRGIEHVEYVGNPLAREVFSAQTKEEFCRAHRLDCEQPIVALLPGSRQKEIVKILPPLLETAALMTAKNPALQFVVAASSKTKQIEIEKTIERHGSKNSKLLKNLSVVAEQTRETVNAADVAAVASGTATLETAIIGTPLAIVYKTSNFNYKLLRPLIKVEHFGLINLIAEERLAAELIQAEFTKETLSRELFRLLEPLENKLVRERLKQATARLGTGGASSRAAVHILNLLESEN